MTNPTPADLAKFGAQVHARMTFEKDWNSLMLAAIEDDAQRAGLTAGDRAEARQVCAQYGLEPSDYGDSLPSLTARNDTVTATQLERVRAQMETLHDARMQEDEASELEAATALIDTLANCAGIDIK